MKQAEIRSDIAWATPTKVVIHGLDLCDDIVGKIDFGQMAFLPFRELCDVIHGRVLQAGRTTRIARA